MLLLLLYLARRLRTEQEGGSSGGQVSERSRRRPTGPQLNEQDGR